MVPLNNKQSIQTCSCPANNKFGGCLLVVLLIYEMGSKN